MFKRHYDNLLINLDNILISQSILSPWFITGLIDGEGYFTFIITKNIKSRLGLTISPRFGICMHKRDSVLIKKIKNYFKVGIYKESGLVCYFEVCYFEVSSIKELEIIINHFKYFPLQSSKRHAFYIFLIIFELYKNKIHLNREGLMLALAYINILNKNIKTDIINYIENLYGHLSNIILPPIKIIEKILIPNPWWINGFIVGEGSFTFFKRTRFTVSGIKKIRLYFSFWNFTKNARFLSFKCYNSLF